MNKLNGFTLIELIVVIVVLGILAVTAAPSFLNFRTDANRALLEGFVASSKGAVSLVYAKALIQGEAEKANGNVDLDGDGVGDIDTVYGYPTADRNTGLSNALTLGEDWAWGNTFGGTEMFFSPSQIVGFNGPTNNNIPLRSPNCYVGYRPPTTANEGPEYTYYDSGC
ncbi:type II secretion system protein [Pseudidiomarina salilacus]|uniref:type II secretion system protein n=1 Tax=Pseudidiomarina salilacus TaxID=3384452 RepID=UPI003984CEB7